MTINIDPSPLIDAYSLSDSDVRDLIDYTVKEVTARFAMALEVEANNTLQKSRLEYISNINVVDEGFAKGAVVLTGELANNIESGKEAYDLKPFFLNGPNAKQGKNGSKYNTIPFTHGTPNALPENFSNIMPEEVYEVAKNKPIREGKNSSEGIKKSELPLKFQQPQVKKIQMPGTNAIVEYQHKHSIHEGIRKQKDSVTKQNSYVSFRRVSEKSDPSSWIHPGFEKRDLFGKTLSTFDVPRIVGEILDEVFE